MPNSLCSCGRLNSAASGGGILLFINDTEVPLVEALLLGALDDVPCDACGRLLGVYPTVVFVCRNPKACWFVLGSLIESHREEIMPQLQARATELNAKLEEMSSLKALRAAVSQILIGRLKEVSSLLEAMLQHRLAEYIRTELAALTSRTFATAYLACTVPQFKLKVERTDGSEVPREELLERFGKAQAMTWIMLWAAWSEGDEPGPIFEADLSRYIDEAFLLPSAVETALDSFDGIASEQELSPLSSYCLEAVRASLCAAADRPNLHATAWAKQLFRLEVAYALVDNEERSAVSRLLISIERARATIPFQSAWDAAVPYLNKFERPVEPRVLDALRNATEKVGYPDLLGQIQGSALIETEAPLSAEDIIKILHNVSSAAESTDEIMAAARIMKRSLLKPGDIGDLEKVGAALITFLGGNHEATAEVDSWLGSCCLELRMPQWFLARIGSTPREWEYELTALSRATLWTERSNALRLLGRSTEALEIIEKVLQIFPLDGRPIDRRVAERNRAILLRDTGALDASLEALERLLPQTAGEERIQTLDSLAMTYLSVGRYEDATSAYEEATREARGPWADLAPQLQAKKAMMLAVVGRDDEAIDVLTNLTGDLNPIALLGVASAWANLLQKKVQLLDGANERIQSVIQQLRLSAEQAEARSDFLTMMGALRLDSMLTEIMWPGEARDLWALVAATAERYGQPLTALDLLELAAYAYRVGEAAEARHNLIQIPGALALDTGATADLWLASQGQVLKLQAGLDQVTHLALENGESFNDIRLVAEMRRDVIGRAQSLRSRPAEAGAGWLQDGLGDQVVGQLAPASGRLAVVEWVETREWIMGLVTVVSADGSVSSHWLKPPAIDLSRLATKLGARLTNWRPGRRGDPFDLPEWQTLEEWLAASLSPHLSEDGHVIFLESQEHAGLPWHVAARRWSASYASSWTSMLSLVSEPARVGGQSVGVVLVPRFRESDRLLRALRASAARTRGFAEASGIHFIEVQDERRCDHQAFSRIMSGSAVAKLLCHGFVDPAEREVALMLAHGGVLPLSLSVASNSPAGRVHRLSWQQCRELPAAPGVIFSAACSSGTSHLVGLGERLGLFTGLRQVGMRSLVAPRWDFFAEAGLPILDDALERYLTGEPVAKALYAACREAELRLPIWLAWNLMVEGDWR